MKTYKRERKLHLTGGGGVGEALSLHPPPRSAPEVLRLFYDFRAFISTLRDYLCWLSCSSNGIAEFVHAVPLHWPHAGEHSRPCLRQVHLALAQSDEPLQLIICRRSDSGEAGRSVIGGSTWPSVTFHS